MFCVTWCNAKKWSEEINIFQCERWWKLSKMNFKVYQYCKELIKMTCRTNCKKHCRYKKQNSSSLNALEDATRHWSDKFYILLCKWFYKKVTYNMCLFCSGVDIDCFRHLYNNFGNTEIKTTSKGKFIFFIISLA